MVSPRDTSLVEKEGADVDEAKREGGATDSDYLNLNCASLCLMVVASMAHIKEKGSNVGKGTKKWCKIFMIAEGKISLSQDAES